MHKLMWLSVFSFAIILNSVVVYGQISNITAQLTDTDGQTWNNGTYLITFIPTPNLPGPFTWNGGQSFTLQFRGSMNGSGTFTVAIPDSNFISPAGSMWQFQLCSNTSAICSSITLPVGGANPNLSTVLSNGLTAPRFQAGQHAYGYADLEVGTPAFPVILGDTYFNVTSGFIRFWNGTIWQNLGAGGGGSGTVCNTGTINFLMIYTGVATTCSDPAFDDGATTANALTYSGTGGMRFSGAVAQVPLKATTAGSGFAITGTNATGNGSGGSMNLTASNGAGVGGGGSVTVTGGTSGVGSTGPTVQVIGGSGTSGGDLSVTAGTSSAGNAGATFLVQGGLTGNGAGIVATAGNTSSIAAGNVILQGGRSTTNTGGIIALRPGVGNAGASNGEVRIGVSGGATAITGVLGFARSSGANEVRFTTGTGTTDYLFQLPITGANGTGIILNSNVAGTITQSFSGDTSHAVHRIAQTANIGTVALCPSAVAGCDVAGQYRVTYYLYSTVTCATPGPAVVGPIQVTWTDNAGTKTAAMPMFTSAGGASPSITTIALGNTTAWAEGTFTFWSTGAVIQYATTGYVACTAGTGTYELDMTTEQVQ